MRARQIILAALFSLVALVISVPLAQAGGTAAAWQMTGTALPTNFAPGDHGKITTGPQYRFIATNIGAEPTDGPITFTDTLPAGLVPNSTLDEKHCLISAQNVTCTIPGPIDPGRKLEFAIVLDVEADQGAVLHNEATISGGGADAFTVQTTTTISADPPAFDFLPGTAGLTAPHTDSEGKLVTQAGSHPYQLTLGLGFPTEKQVVNGLGAAGHPRDISTDLPAGTLVDPTSTPVLCTEAELISNNKPGCPPESQIGTATTLSVAAVPQGYTSALFNMVPPPGMPAEFGFDPVGVGIYVHIVGQVRSDGDFGLSGISRDTFALTQHPLFGIRLDLWGDPSAAIHEEMRGNCLASDALDFCHAEPQKVAFLTLPGHCTGQPSTTVARANSWEEPGVFKEATYRSADLAGNPASVDGCDKLQFEPTISAQPTTDLTDSPSGLDFTLHQPQDTQLQHLATAALRNAEVTLPAGISVNPSQAGGLQACTAAEIGMTTGVGETPAHFSKSPDSCPDASKLGTLQVKTPLLGQTDESGTKYLHDPETGSVIPRTLEGSVYLAKPYQNPFDSLLAIYLSINDPQSGTIAKLAGQVQTDPATGQLTTVFEENPQLPLEDVKLHLFGGARGALITPPNCATHTTTTDLVPWSSPETPDAHPSDSFQTTAAPGGGACPATPAAAPNAPTFTAGTLSAQAGAYSPFVLKLSREDGSARLTGFDTTLPPGLSGRLAGIPACSDAALAQAASRSNPEQGALELANPSCPAASKLGTVDVAAGAGPTPFHTQGTAYLAGPYKGAPLSMAVITPAIAGPFDLGTVVVRAALHVDPDTTQIHAVSDPFPTILHGIPLDLRSVAVSLDRPDFTLNPTSCDEMAITGSATSVFNQIAPLTQRFQVGGCSALPFKPKLSLTLKGKTKRTSHPTLIANLTAKPGEANIAKAQVKLPGAAFLDQGHIGTVCTRPQFASHACPPASVYGTVSATTPLLDYTLTGNVYLRSSTHQLPDLVADLNGPSTQPIEIALAGKTDAVKGALRNTFEAVPDQPVSKFHLELFGGKRGLIILSSGLCKNPKAQVKLDGQNGKNYDTDPVVKTSCPKQKKKSKHHKGGGAHR